MTLFSDEPSPATTVTARVECSAVFFEKDAIAELIESEPGAAIGFAAYLSARIRFLTRRIEALTAGDSVVNLLENKNGADIAPFLAGDFVKIEFRMQIEDLVDSTIMQLYPIDFAKSLYEIFMGQQMGTSAAPAQPEPQPTPQPEPQPILCKNDLI